MNNDDDAKHGERKSDFVYQSITSSLSNINFNPDNDLHKIHEYIELNKQASSLISNNKFLEALNIYQKALKISEKLKDNYKINESKCNMGITNFYLMKLNDAINCIKSCYSYIHLICSTEIGVNSIRNLYLLCKSGANLCMCQVIINCENNYCITLMNNIINILSQENDLSKQLYCIKYLNYTLFRVNSLLTEKNNYLNKFSLDDDNDNDNNNHDDNEEDENIFNNYEINSNEEQMNKINNLFIESFESFIATGKLESWLDSLTILKQKMEKLKDKSGIIFTLFNQLLATCLKKNNNTMNNKEINNAKTKLSSLLMSFSQIKINDIDNNGNMNIINNNLLINKITYKESIANSPNFNNNINNEYSLKLLLKYTKKNFKENIKDINLRNKLINDVDNVLDLIDNKKIDVSQLNISLVDPDISIFLTRELDNFSKFYNKRLAKEFFEKIKNKKHKKKNKKNTIVNKNLENFFETQYSYICTGTNIKK